MRTYCNVPVDLRYSCVEIQTEHEQQNSSNNGCTTADEFKEIKAFAWGAFHDGLDADEGNQCQNLKGGISGK